MFIKELENNYLTFYRYGFNGQEKDDEVAGSGNSYTAEFWQYDSRTGRRWNVDPKPTPSNSSYLTFNNNPIYNIDILGDTSVYHDDKGNFLRMIPDNLENAVVIIPTEKLATFNENISANEGNKGINSSGLGKKLRGLGDSYMTDDLFNFYDDNSAPDNSLPYGDYANEHGTYLYKNNGEIRPGKENFEGGDEHTTYGTNNRGGTGPRVPGATRSGRAHTHPNEGLPNEQGIPLPGGGTPSSAGGLGGGDWGSGGLKLNTFNVVIGKTQLTIYGYKEVGGEIKKVSITINRNLGTNKGGGK